MTATTTDLIAIALKKGAPLALVDRLIEDAARRESLEARKAFTTALAKLKEETATITRDTTAEGTRGSYSFAQLSGVVETLTPALSRHGFTATWKNTKDDRDWIEVTCTLSHIGGHSESTSMGGPPSEDDMTPVQARAGTVTLLERYTLKAVTGTAEAGQDTDASRARPVTPAPTPAAPPSPAATTRSTWTPEAFATRLPKWREAIEAGGKTPGEIVRFAEAINPLTVQQRQQIEALRPASKLVAEEVPF